MKSRKNYKKMISKKKTQGLTRKGAVLASLSILTLASATPVLASTWKANAPDSIQIKSGDISYTMVFGDTLWAISMKINVNVETLASINNINLANGEEFHLAVGTIIKWEKGILIAETPEGNIVNNGIQADDSNKIIPDKPIGTDVTNDVKDNNISDNQVNGNPSNIGNSGSNDPDTSGEKPTNPSKPEDKWKDLIFEERDGGTTLRIGPFDSYEDAEYYFNHHEYKAGNIFENTLDGKFYIEIPIKDTPPVEPTEPTNPEEPVDPKPDPTEPTTGVGIVTVHYVDQDGKEIKESKVMTGTIGETFNAVGEQIIPGYLLNIMLLPAGSVLGDDGNGHFVNEFTQDPQTVTFVYYIDQYF